MPNIVDTTVVNQAYSTAGNGGRRIVQLSNGWFIVCLIEKTAGKGYVYKSEDNGSSWTQLGTLTYSDYGGASILEGTSLSVKGNTVYWLQPFSTHVQLIVFDPTNFDGNFTTKSTTVETGQTAVGATSSILNTQGTNLHLTWTSKNATYPSSFNIRYLNVTITEEGITLGAVEQVTKINTSTDQCNNPTIVLNALGEPVITLSYNSSNTSIAGGIITQVRVNGEFVTKNIYVVSNRQQNNPCAVFVPKELNGLANGRLWVVWQGMDSTDTAVDNIRYSYSDDGGLTWTTQQKLTSGNVYQCQYPTISVSRENKLVIVYSKNDNYSIQKFEYINGSFSSSTVLVSNTGVTGTPYPNALLDSEVSFSEPLFVYMDRGTARVCFYGVWRLLKVNIIKQDYNDVQIQVDNPENETIVALRLIVNGKVEKVWTDLTGTLTHKISKRGLTLKDNNVKVEAITTANI